MDKCFSSLQRSNNLPPQQWCLQSQLRMAAYIMLIVIIIYNHFVYYCRVNSCHPRIEKIIIIACPQNLLKSDKSLVLVMARK